MKNDEKLFKAIGDIDEDLIAQAEITCPVPRTRKRRAWGIGLSAAVIIIAVAAVGLPQLVDRPGMDDSSFEETTKDMHITNSTTSPSCGDENDSADLYETADDCRGDGPTSSETLNEFLYSFDFGDVESVTDISIASKTSVAAVSKTDKAFLKKFFESLGDMRGGSTAGYDPNAGTKDSALGSDAVKKDGVTVTIHFDDGTELTFEYYHERGVIEVDGVIYSVSDELRTLLSEYVE